MFKTLFEEEIEQQNKRIKSIKKIKIVVTSIGLATILGITGYSINKNIENTKFTYISDENNDFKAEGKIKYSEVSDWYLIEKELLNGKTKLFIVDKNLYKKPIDVITGVEIAESISKIYSTETNTYHNQDNTVVKVSSLDDYLITYDMVKAYYTIDDIKNLLSLIEKDYEYNSSKELSK